MVILMPSCPNCGGPFTIRRVRDAKWEKHGKKPMEGRAVMVCQHCGERKKKTMTVGQAVATHKAGIRD